MCICMPMCVCVSVCVHVCTCVVYLHVCAHVYVYVLCMHMCLCVCIHVHMCGYVFTCSRMCGQMTTSGVISQPLSTTLFRLSFSYLASARLTAQKVPGIHVPHLCHVGITSAHYDSWLHMWALGAYQTQVLVLSWQRLSWPCHFPAQVLDCPWGTSQLTPEAGGSRNWSGKIMD